MSQPALSVLDPAPIFEGKSGADAFSDTITLAQRAEALGYRSYWVQEHHNAPCFASVAPEILIAALGAHTSTIRLGSGGVMLPNYSPLKIAEQFAALETLYPGRIELGLGRATGADPRASAALLGPGPNEFPQMLRLLLDWLLDTSAEQRLSSAHPAYGIKANPQGYRPDVWMLSSSVQSAAFAGQMGLKLAFADFLSPGGAEPALRAYKDAFQPSRFAREPYCAIGLVALASETEASAQHIFKSALAWNVKRARGEFALFPSISVAEAQLASVEEALLASLRQRATIGSGQQVGDKLNALSRQCGANEIFILTIAETLELRTRSYELIAEAFGR